MSKQSILAALLLACLIPATAIGAPASDEESAAIGTLVVAGQQVLQVSAVAEYSADERVTNIWNRIARCLMMPKRTGNSPAPMTTQPYDADLDVAARVRPGQSALMFHGTSVALATQGDADILKVPVEAVAAIWAKNLKVGLKAMDATARTPFRQALAKMTISVDGRNLPMDNSGAEVRFPEYAPVHHQ